jgi:hypothetical protein
MPSRSIIGGLRQFLSLSGLLSRVAAFAVIIVCESSLEVRAQDRSDTEQPYGSFRVGTAGAHFIAVASGDHLLFGYGDSIWLLNGQTRESRLMPSPRAADAHDWRGGGRLKHGFWVWDAVTGVIFQLCPTMDDLNLVFCTERDTLPKTNRAPLGVFGDGSTLQWSIHHGIAATADSMFVLRRNRQGTNDSVSVVPVARRRAASTRDGRIFFQAPWDQMVAFAVSPNGSIFGYIQHQVSANQSAKATLRVVSQKGVRLWTRDFDYRPKYVTSSDKEKIVARLAGAYSAEFTSPSRAERAIRQALNGSSSWPYVVRCLLDDDSSALLEVAGDDSVTTWIHLSSDGTARQLVFTMTARPIAFDGKRVWLLRQERGKNEITFAKLDKLMARAGVDP